MRSIKHKLVVFGVSHLLVAFAVVLCVVYIAMNRLVGDFMELGRQSSVKIDEGLVRDYAQSRERMASMIRADLRKKGSNLVERDLLVIRPSYQENAFVFIREFLDRTFAFDEDILVATFFTAEGEDIKAWHYVSREHPQGLGLRTTYDRVGKSWVSDLEGGRRVVVPDPSVLDILGANTTGSRMTELPIVGSDGRPRMVKVYEVFAPVVGDETAAEGTPVGYLRYALTLDNMRKAIETEESELTALLARRKDEQARALEQAQALAAASERRGIVLLGATAGAVLLLSILTSFRTSARLTRPIDELIESTKAFGRGELDRPVVVRGDDEIGKLGDAFEHMRVEVIRYLAESHEKARMEAEIDAARVVQSSLLPGAIALPGLELAYSYQAALQTGGDWLGCHYDRGNHRLEMCIGDVTGHGFPSALLTGVVYGAFYGTGHLSNVLGAIPAEDRLVHMARIVNRVVHDAGCRQQLMTMIFVSLDLDTGELAYINAGHMPFFVISPDGQVKGHLAASPMLGFDGGTNYAPTRLRIAPGDTLFFNTDGLTENRGPDGQTAYRSLKLRRRLKQAVHPAELIGSVLEDAGRIWQNAVPEDDVTVLAVRWTEAVCPYAAREALGDDVLVNLIADRSRQGVA